MADLSHDEINIIRILQSTIIIFSFLNQWNELVSGTDVMSYLMGWSDIFEILHSLPPQVIPIMPLSKTDNLWPLLKPNYL
jgi:hypothetical protein